MSENNKIGTYKFVAEPFHVALTCRIKIAVIRNHLLHIARIHSTARV